MSAGRRPDVVGDPSGLRRPHYTPLIEILIVCTGNTCRSPMAEALLRRTLSDRGIAAAVSSAGLLSDGQPATDTGVDTLAARGLDISGHRSRRIDPELLGTGDLIVGMAREHVRQAVVMRPDLYRRTFTLKELVRRGGEVGARGGDEPLDAWLDRVHAGRVPTQQLGSSLIDDVADPIGQPAAVYERTARELDDLTTRLADLLWQEVPSTTPA
jgi:protein-tyrosine-phosphatase